MGAGKYWQKCRRYVYSEVKDNNSGQKVPTFTAGSDYWCWIFQEKAEEQVTMGTRQHVVEAKIHINNYPALDAKDRLLDLETNYLYQIKGVLLDYDVQETVAECYRVPSLEAI